MMTDKKNIKKVMGVVLICIALITAGIYIKTYYFDSADKTTEKNSYVEGNKEKKDISKLPRKEVEKHLQSKETLAKIDTDIKYKMPKGIEERLDAKKFDKEFKKYLNDNYLFTRKTVATCQTGQLTIDYNKNYIAFDLVLNDKNRTTVTVALDSEGKYSFAHY